MTLVDQKEIHNITLNMMDVIHDICEHNLIEYYLIYGTLIGAIRHNGFIPWDDDFDICMKRDDYNKFCKIVKEKSLGPYKLCTRANTDGYYYGIPRFVDTRYVYKSDLVELRQFTLGIFIDIYPFDYYGDTIEESKRIKSICSKWNTVYMIYTNRKSLRGTFHTILRTPIHYFYRLKYGGHLNQRIDSILENEIKVRTNSMNKYIGEIVWDSRDLVPFNVEWFHERVLHDFEDRKYWIPRDYDYILKKQYDDYMQLPPANERVPSHSYKIYKKE